ncbi:MAG: endopeptidase La [bacterium]
MVRSFDQIETDELVIPQELSLLPVRDIVIFPYMIIPLFVGRQRSIMAVDDALSKGKMIFLLTQKNSEVDDPTIDDLYKVGTVGLIMRLLKMPDGRVKILVQGLTRARLVTPIQTEPFFKVNIERIVEPEVKQRTLKLEASIRNIKSQLEESLSMGKMIVPEVVAIASNIEDPGKLADLVISNLSIKIEEMQNILETINPEERLNKVCDVLNREMQVLAMQQKINTQAKEEMDKDQREYFLRQQMKAIQHELGDIDGKAQDITELHKKIKEANMPEAVNKEAEKQLEKLERMHPDAAEAGMVRTYIEWLGDMPWDKRTTDNLDIKKASEVLDEDHYDLEKIKDRILEYLAVRRLKEKMKGPILCFVGPPGVGKTSLGKSIARALGRKFVRISLGGVRDEAEIRGHRRTYIGALPGKIIQGIKQAGVNNPVFMMDEVDKIGSDFRGDPSAALLEVLDPEQNNAFTDHYLGVPFDLSDVMFITTANILDPILPPFRDRMEILQLSGYTEIEKQKIAKRFLIPRQLEENGISEKFLEIKDNALLKIITNYTREAGLRNLEREIATVCRKVAKEVAEGKTSRTVVTSGNLHKYLGILKYTKEEELEKNEIGVSTGLAWTESGGDIIHIEATLMKGKGILLLTGHLGDIMKESAHAALSYARSQAEKLGINNDVFSSCDIHIHVPAGAIPKDGPSAGITIATAIISVLTNKAINKKIAMTGEITLRGKVLPIGGLKEKILAAKRAGIETVIVPEMNKKDLTEIPNAVKRNISFVYAKTMADVLEKTFVS